MEDNNDEIIEAEIVEDDYIPCQEDNEDEEVEEDCVDMIAGGFFRRK